MTVSQNSCHFVARLFDIEL